MMNMRLETERLVLRSVVLEDAPRIHELVSDRQISATITSIPHPYPENQAREWLESVLNSEDEGRELLFGIIRKTDELFMGLISIDAGGQHDSSEVGYWIGVDYWGKGYMTEALVRIIQYGFEDLGLNRIYATHFHDNPASGRVMQKAGMTYEATMRQKVKKWDAYKDLLYYGILREEYLSIPS